MAEGGGAGVARSAQSAESDAVRQGLGRAISDLLEEHWPDSGVNGWYLADLLRDGHLASIPPLPVAHGKAWEDRLNIICLCGKVCSAVVRKNPAGGFIGRPGSDTYVDPPAAQVFADHLWAMNHPPLRTTASTTAATDAPTHHGEATT